MYSNTPSSSKSDIHFQKWEAGNLKSASIGWCDVPHTIVVAAVNLLDEKATEPLLVSPAMDVHGAHLNGESTGAVDTLAVVDVRLDNVFLTLAPLLILAYRVIEEVHDRRHTDAL